VNALTLDTLKVLALTFMLGTYHPDPLLGQIPDPVRIQPDSLAPDSIPPDSVAQDTVPAEVGPERISPRGAFIRSALIPGWGHAKVGAFVRGGFYFGVEAAAGFMVFKTQTRISRTRAQLALREEVVTARLEAQGITDPVEIEAGLAEDPVVEDLRSLEVTRQEQREDWIALGLFFMLIGGVDGYVSAHLADFPVAVVIEPNPNRGMELGFSLPVSF
jgi:hypothetical protein